jgi:restriction endonuclease Mrr
VIKAVGDELADRLTETDRSLNTSGLIRWENRVQFARLTLVKTGDMDSTSRRGIWRITEKGRQRAAGS